MVEEDEVKLPRIYYVWHTPALYAPGDAEMDVLASVLTGGKSSRLYKPLVFEQKVAKDVAAFQVSMHLASFFVIQATAAPGKSLDELKEALDKALKTALETPPTQVEMTRVVNGWKKSFYGRIQAVLSRAQLLSGYFHQTGQANYLNQDLARYTGAQAAQVHEYAQTHLSASRLRLDIVPKPTATQAGGAEGAKGAKQ